MADRREAKEEGVMANACGSCTACCRVYAIPTIQKPAGKWCDHCAIGKSCKIYEERPTLCVDFECLWLMSQSKDAPLAAELRPDKSKVVFSPTTNEKIMSAITMPGAPDAWRRGPVRLIIDRMVASGMNVVIGPPASIRKTMVDKYGEREVEMTEPDENGMQWSVES
jgi:hypothetical protein